MLYQYYYFDLQKIKLSSPKPIDFSQIFKYTDVSNLMVVRRPNGTI